MAEPGSRTPFASSVIVDFPPSDFAWVRPASPEVALIDAHGRVERFASEGELHAEVLRRHAWVTRRAETIVAREAAADRAEAFDGAPWWARLPYLIAGASAAQLRAAGLIVFIPLSVWAAAEIVTRSLILLAEISR